MKNTAPFLATTQRRAPSLASLLVSVSAFITVVGVFANMPEPQAPDLGLLYEVNSTGDGTDWAPGDGLCETAPGNFECTLRAAIAESNAHAGTDGIQFSFPAYPVTINLNTALPEIIDSVNITGTADPRNLTVQRSTLPRAPKFRIFFSQIDSPGTLSVSGLTISNGFLTDGSSGAGIGFFGSATATITNCIITGNSTEDFGGGGGISGNYLSVNDSTISGNSAGFGGAGAWVAHSTFTNCSIRNNTGIGIEAYPETTLTNCSISNNATYGIYATNGGPITIKNSNVNDNFGGVLAANPMTMDFTNCTISGNTSSIAGGGILNLNATVNLTNCTVSGNGAPEGGGISNGHLGNDFSDFPGTTNITNCTLSGNFTSDSAGLGGGIFNSSYGDVKVSNSTISGNVATGAGNRIGNSHPSSFNTPLEVKSSLIADTVAGEFQSQGYNLVRNTDGSTGFTASTDQTGTDASPLDPQLDLNGLQNNGGPTLTIALLSDSPARDKATSIDLSNQPLTTDQRAEDFPRTIDDPAIPNTDSGDGTDVGAFEAAVPIPAAPHANPAGKITASSFNAKWDSATGATGYRLDVSTNRSFTTYLPGYQDLGVGNVTKRSVTGLTASTKYFYRVRAYNTSGTSANSNVIRVTTKWQ